MRKARPDTTILALFRSPAPRITRTTGLLSLGRTLPESRLRRLPFGILSRCQLPRPNCQRTKRADDVPRTFVPGTPAARDCHGQRFAPAAKNRHPERASTHDVRQTPATLPRKWTRPAGSTGSRAAKREPIPNHWDRPHLYEKLAEGFGTVKRLKKVPEKT